MARQRVLIIGGGIVGLATAQALIARGHPITVLDPDPEGDSASWGNAGGIALPEIVPASAPGVFLKVPGWLMDPLGPLSLRPLHLPRMIPWLWHFSRVASRPRMGQIAAALAELHRHAEADLTAMLAAEGLQDRMTRSGALYVYESAKGFAVEAADWTLRRTHGFDHTALTGDQAREIEPALGPIVTHAVLTPDWLQIADPKALHLDLLAALRAKGLQVLRRNPAE
jgi:D-amino-acid dehydrogenase